MSAGTLNAEPLKALIREDAARAARLHDESESTRGEGSGFQVLALRLGSTWNERIFRRVLTQEMVSEDLADRYCCATNRHLSEVYPELYHYDSDTELFAHPCKACGCSLLEVRGEGRWRIMLRCPTCGKRTQLIRPDDPSLPMLRQSGGWNARIDLRVNRDVIIEAYSSGASLSELAERYDVGTTTISKLLRRAGVATRPSLVPRDPVDARERLKAGRRNSTKPRTEGGRALTRVKWARMTRLRGQGWTTRAIATHFGMHPGGVRAAFFRYTLEPTVARVCVNPDCENFDERYETPMDDVVAHDPWLATCPECYHEGELADLWHADEEEHAA
jgi:transposase-like protein